MLDRDRLYIGGAWVPSTAAGTLDVVGASTEEVIGRVPAGTAEDVDRAVAAARAAFPAWAATSVEERSKYLQRITEGIQARMADLGAVIAQEVGTPINLATAVQVGLPIMVFGTMPQVLASVTFEEEIGNSLVVREPIGVVGAITPWNYPLHQVAAKVAPALAAGCTIVLKPSEVAPLSAFGLAEIVEEAGLPPGVFNLVTGLGPVVGGALAAHPEADMVSFTGSSPVGRRVAAEAAATVKRVSLELGGKSPSVILDDADLSRAVPGTLAMAFLNSGQTCIALSRMLVPRHRLAEVEERVVQEVASFAVGDPMTPGTRLGPLASAAQRERVRGYIEAGLAEGAKLLIGGVDPPEGLDRGYYVRPTVFSEVTPEMTVAREEIFGPVLAIIPYDDEEDAVAKANDSPYGLNAAVWAGDRDRAMRVGRRLQSGQVEINGGTFNPLAPFGGFKQSGNGRELGRYGLEEFLETKSFQR